MSGRQPIERSGFTCLRRAALSLRANPGLVPLVVLQSLVVALLFIASLVPPFLVLDGVDLITNGLSESAVEAWVEGLPGALAAQPGAVALAVLGSFVLGLVAVLAWGWFQGGLYGTLVAAEHQALPDAQDRSGGTAWFRTFGMREFAGWGGRSAWRYFWFFHLLLTVGLLLFLLVALVVFGVVLGYDTWGAGAAYGIGCGASLPLLFVFVVWGFWWAAAQPFLVLPEVGVGRATRAGLRLVGRRPGAMLLIALVLFVIAATVGIGFLVVELGLGLLQEAQPVAWAVLYGLSAIVQLLFNAAFGIFGNAAFTSLAVAHEPEVVR